MIDTKPSRWLDPGTKMELAPGLWVEVKPSRLLPLHGDPGALLVAAAARAEQRRLAREPAPVVVPAVEVPIRQATRSEMPQAAVRLAEQAMAAGWSAYARYTRGPWRTGTTDRSRWVVADRVIVNFWRTGVKAVACWANGRTTGAMWWVSGTLPRPIGVEALQSLIIQGSAEGSAPGAGTHP